MSRISGSVANLAREEGASAQGEFSSLLQAFVDALADPTVIKDEDHR